MKKRRPILARINKPLGPFIGEPQITANAANQPVTRASSRHSGSQRGKNIIRDKHVNEVLKRQGVYYRGIKLEGKETPRQQQ